MKKILALLLALSMAAVAVSCGDKKEEADNKAGTQTEESGNKTAEEENDNTEKPATENSDEAELSGEEAENNAEQESEKEPEKEPEINYNTEEDKAAAKTAVEGFMNAFCTYDIGAMSQYSNIDLAQKLGFDDFRAYIDNKVKGSFSEEESLVIYADDIIEIVNLSYDKILDSTAYEITGAEYADGKWTFDVNVSLVTLADITSALQGEKAQELVDEVIPDELLLQLEAEGGEVSPELIDSIINGMLSGTVRLLRESCENAQPNTYEYKLTAAKISDNWVVDYNAADAAEIVGLIG